MQHSNLFSGRNHQLIMMGKVSVSRTIAAIVIMLCLLDFTASQDLKFRSRATEMKQEPSESLQLLWGLPDTMAYVGKLFKYTLPNDAFQGNVVRYDVTDLPSFLTFNDLKAELEGVPGPKDKGLIYVEVVAIGDDNTKARDVFSIEVLDSRAEPPQQVQLKESGSSAKSVRCRREQSQTIMTLIVDIDLDVMKPNEKVKLLENLVGHLNLNHDMLTLLPKGQKPLFDSDALVSGPGNVESPKSAGALLSWVVGCGSVEKDHMAILQLVEASTKSSDMAIAIGNDIIGWQVTNTRFHERKRIRRAVTQTPTMSISPPTKASDMMSDTKTIAATSVVIMPTKTVDMKPSSVVVDPKSSVQKGTISPSSTIKMSKTMDMQPTATTALPDRTYTMTSSSDKSDEPVVPSTTSTTTSSTRTTVPTTPKSTTPEPLCAKQNVPPIVNRPFSAIEIPAGNIKRIKIADDTFFDCYNNATQDLEVKITFRNGSLLPPGFWLQTVRKVFRPYVMLSSPLPEHVGRYRMKMEAKNIYQKSSSFNFDIYVTNVAADETPPNHELGMTLDTDYDAFMLSLNNRIDLSRKVSNLFGDKNSNSLTVLGINRGSVMFKFTNNSVPTGGCPVDEITQLVDKIMNPDGSLTDEAINAVRPYKLASASSAPLGSCTNNPNFPARSSRSVKVTTPAPTTMAPKPKTSAPATAKPKTDAPKTDKPDTKPPTETTTKPPVAAAGAGGGGGSDIWITTVVPAIVVVIVLIIALIIACCLYRKKRKGKMKLEEQNGYGHNKGVPVIFADEYDEKPNESSRPLIMEDEKPPMPPPEYQRASSETSGNSNSTQPIDDRYREDIEMEDTDVTSPLYSPPPPVTASNHSKPPHVQSSRGLPPPYVPP